MSYVPFFQGTEATNVIKDYLNENITADTPMQPADLNENNVFRNPYSPEGFYANDTDQYPVDSYTPPVADEEGIPSCPEGYVYDEVMKSCRFVGYTNETSQNDDREDPEERLYMSIENMKSATDKDLLDYLTSGFLGNSILGYLPSKGSEVTMKDGFMPPQFKLLFGGQDKLRKDFIMAELQRRGYFTGKFDKSKNPIFDIQNKNINTNVGGIESQLPQNVQGNPVTDIYGDTYQLVTNQNGNTGYTFTSGNPQDGVSNVYNYPGMNVNSNQNTNRVYGTGRGGTSSNQMTGGSNITPSAFAVNYEDDYGADI